VGPMRWKPPAQVAAWTGERDATRFGAACPQHPSPDIPEMREDCLYLNVWAPKAGVGNAAKLPVMVWIYGGGWRNGRGSDPVFDGAPFARDGVIMVTVNYRLGALGIFAHPALTREAAADEPLGNYGLMDNIAALDWVKRNISAFGGDPNRVTVFGESAGGGQVLSLLTTPRAKGLFQQAIVESGPAFSSPRPLAEAEQSGIALAQHMGLPKDATADQLRAMDAQALVPVAVDTAPFVDGRLVKELPQTAFENHREADVPTIIGANTYEGSLTPSYAAGADQVMALYRSRNAMNELKALYGADAPDATMLRNQVFGDTIFGAPARKIADEGASGAPMFLYRFGYVAEALRKSWPGAAHGSDPIYIFDNLKRLRPAATTQDLAIADVMHGCWASFAKTGRPTCPGGPVWPAYDSKTDRLMLFKTEGQLQVVRGYDKARFDHIQRLMLDRTVPSQAELVAMTRSQQAGGQ
jgi:para-nitrobenzyl esterase